MYELMLTTVSQLRQSLRQVLALHLIFTGMGIIAFAPLLGAFGYLLLFALTPAGIGAFILFAAVSKSGYVT
jgi:hypothetical protein